LISLFLHLDYLKFNNSIKCNLNKSQIEYPFHYVHYDIVIPTFIFFLVFNAYYRQNIVEL